MPFELTGDIPYVHKPNLVYTRAQGLSIINTDSLGRRSKVVGAQYEPKTKQEYRIAIVGDSGTFGEGVSRTEDTYPQVLEDALNRKQAVLKVQVLNYGVSAYSVKEIAATLKHRILQIDPDLVLMTILDHDFVLARTPTANISYKPWGIFRLASQPGVMEMLFTRQLREEGAVLIADDRLVVSHVQSHGFWGHPCGPIP